MFEGLDKSGKSTQCGLLDITLTESNIKTTRFRFPSRTSPIGRVIDAHLANTETEPMSDEATHLLFSANRWEMRAAIEKLLARGETVIVDRYSYSGVAFSAAKGLSREWCVTTECGLPQPDLVIFLDIKDGVAAKRDGFGAERYETAAFQKLVRAQFEDMKGASGWAIIDGSAPIKDVRAKVLKLALASIAACATTKLDRLSPLSFSFACHNADFVRCQASDELDVPSAESEAQVKADLDALYGARRSVVRKYVQEALDGDVGSPTRAFAKAKIEMPIAESKEQLKADLVADLVALYGVAKANLDVPTAESEAQVKADLIALCTATKVEALPS